MGNLCGEASRATVRRAFECFGEVASVALYRAPRSPHLLKEDAELQVRVCCCLRAHRSAAQLTAAHRSWRACFSCLAGWLAGCSEAVGRWVRVVPTGSAGLALPLPLRPAPSPLQYGFVHLPASAAETALEELNGLTVCEQRPQQGARGLIWAAAWTCTQLLVNNPSSRSCLPCPAARPLPQPRILQTS